MAFKKAIFLDRDGVIVIPINRDQKGYAPTNLSEFKFYDNTKKALIKLHNAGYFKIIVSNQPDIASGLLHPVTLEKMSKLIFEELSIEEINNCVHSSTSKCLCRKPNPGMILTSIEKNKIDVDNSWMIGDRDSDISAGLKAGLKTIFINQHWHSETGASSDKVCNSLSEAADYIITYNKK